MPGLRELQRESGEVGGNYPNWDLARRWELTLQCLLNTVSDEEPDRNECCQSWNDLVGFTFPGKS